MGIFNNLGYKLLAAVIALFLWMVARGESSIERGFDIPVVIHGLPDDLVVTDKSADVVNVRVMGSRAALRNVGDEQLEYPLPVDGAQPGVSDYEVEVQSKIELPRGARIVSRSPSHIEMTFERRATRAVRVRADVEGTPAEGYRVTVVDVDPPRVKITGARSEVLRLSEVVTEKIDVAGATEPMEREVRVSPGARHVWADTTSPVKVSVGIEAEPKPEPEPIAEPGPEQPGSQKQEEAG